MTTIPWPDTFPPLQAIPECKPVEPDAEARAVDECVKALARIPKKRGTQHWNSDLVPNTSAVERVLRYCATRYGVDLDPRHHEPPSGDTAWLPDPPVQPVVVHNHYGTGVSS